MQPPQDMPTNIGTQLPTTFAGVLHAILAFAIRYGLSVVLLIAAVLWFNWKTDKLEYNVKECNDQLLQQYKEQNEALTKILSRNTEALELISSHYTPKRPK